ncbi:MAG: TonB-dependent receptor [Chitinophagaceae bacterium]|nr:MAG: TonB-dependent receptor [Chitinophagaceae bacterium]
MHKTILAALGLMTTASVMAQVDSIKPVLEEVTISATRFPEKTSRIAQQVYQFSEKRIANANQSTTADLLNNSGAVFVQKSQFGGGSPVIRGFEANKILMVVDGIRMNNAIYRGGHLQNIITIDNSILQKAEILFGPSSVMYGSDALGGVMSFYTRNPAFSSTDKTMVTGNAYLRYTSAANEKTVHADMNVAGKNFASLTSVTYSDFDDLRQGGNYYNAYPQWGKRNFYVERINGIDSMITNSNLQKQKFTGYQQYDLLQKFAFATGKINHVVNLQYSTSSNIPRYDRLTETTGAGIAKFAEWYYGPQQRLLAAWHFNLPASRLYDQSNISLSYQKIGESRHNRNYRSNRISHRKERVNIYALNADFKKNFLKDELGYGVEVNFNKVGSEAQFENIVTGETGPTDTRYPADGSNTQSYSAYASLIHKFSKNFTGNAGARFNHSRLEADFSTKAFYPFPFDDINQHSSNATGSLSLVYSAESNYKLSASVATGYRVPNVDDLAKVFESTASNLIIPNPSLRPERTISYELGAEKYFGNKVRFAVVAWYTDYSNALTLGDATYKGQSSVLYNGGNAAVKTTVNAAKAFNKGLNANLTAGMGPIFSLYSTITYTYGRIKEDAGKYPLDHIPPVFGKTSLVAAKNKIRAEVFALYNGRKSAEDFNLRGEDNQLYSADPVKGFVPAWVTFNANVSYQFNNHFRLQASLENISDKFYRYFASGVSAPGRNAGITARYSF